VDSRSVEVGALVGQGILEVLVLGQVEPDSIFVEFAVLVAQSVLEVLLISQVSLCLLTVSDAPSSLVVGTLLVREGLFQVLGLLEVLLNSIPVVLVGVVGKRLVVEFDVLELCQNSLPQSGMGLVVLNQLGELVVVPLCVSIRVRGRHGSLGSLRSLGSLGSVSVGRSGCGFTSLEVFKVLPSFQVHSFDVTSIEGRVLTSLQVRIVELSCSDFVVGLTNFEFRVSEGISEYGSAEEGDGKESELRFVLHDV